MSAGEDFGADRRAVFGEPEMPLEETARREARRGLLLGPQRRERLVPEHVEAGQHADRRDEHRRQHDAGGVLADEDAPRDVERVPADAPGQADGAERPDEARQQARARRTRTAASARSSACWRRAS